MMSSGPGKPSIWYRIALGRHVDEVYQWLALPMLRGGSSRWKPSILIPFRFEWNGILLSRVYHNDQ